MHWKEEITHIIMAIERRSQGAWSLNVHITVVTEDSDSSLDSHIYTGGRDEMRISAFIKGSEILPINLWLWSKVKMRGTFPER